MLKNLNDSNFFKTSPSDSKLLFNSPKIHVISDSDFASVNTDFGTGYLKFSNIFLTRFREDVISGIYGIFFYIRNLTNEKMWSASFAPSFTKPSKYEVEYKSHLATFSRCDENILTTMQVIVSNKHSVELRKIKITNKSTEELSFDLTSYMEITLCPIEADIAHMSFSNLFIQTEYLNDTNSIIANRRPRSQNEQKHFLFHTLLKNVDKNKITYETDRMKFLGRNKTVLNPKELKKYDELSGTTGAVLDPIASIRTKFTLKPNECKSFTFATGYSPSRSEAINTIKYYQNSTFEKILSLSEGKSEIENKYFGFSSIEQKLYYKLLSKIIFSQPKPKELEIFTEKNTKGQDGFWQYGISGDNPIITLQIIDGNFEYIKQILNAHEFWKHKLFKVDLILIYENFEEKIINLVNSRYLINFKNTSDGIFILNRKNLNDEFINLLFAGSRIVINDKEFSNILENKPNILNKKEFPFALDFFNYSLKPPEIDMSKLKFWNGYGGFDVASNEYVIILKNNESTPLPWVNVISNPKLGFVISEKGGGYTWCENSRENRLTPWFGDTLTDQTGEKLYICDNKTGCVFSPFENFSKNTNEHIVRHGIGYTTFENTTNKIYQNLKMFVPREDPVKIIFLSLKNLENSKKDLTLSYYVQVVMGAFPETNNRFIKIKKLKNGTIVAENKYNSSFSKKIMFVHCSEKIFDFTNSRLEFFGNSKLDKIPQGVLTEKLNNSTATEGEPCIALRLNIILEPNEEKKIVILVGEEENKAEILKLCEKYEKIENTEGELLKVVQNWKNITEKIQIKTPDESFNIMINSWLLYQTISCRIFGRSSNYQSGGAYGFRDQLQDSLATIYSLPQITKNQIIKHANHQFLEGDVQHWWHESQTEHEINESVEKNINNEISHNQKKDAIGWEIKNKNKIIGCGDKGIRTKFSDDLLWLPFSVCEYIKKTEDYKILDEKVHFIEGKILDENTDEKYFVPNVSQKEENIYKHCIRAIEKSLVFGKHKIPLMGSGDWNDGMNKVGNQGKGESVWVGWFLIDILNKFSEISILMKDNQRSENYKNIAKEISKSINENAWDGNWYKRAYFDNGSCIGSIENKECIIDSIAQSWSVISGGGETEKTKLAIENMQKYLFHKENKLIKLLTPPFKTSNPSPGYIEGYVEGVRENGGQYTHAAIWAIIALSRLNMCNEAYEAFAMLNPINHSLTKEGADNYKIEPYVLAADVYTNSQHRGRGGWSWYTGASGWMYRTGIEEIIGFNLNGNVLNINPKLPSYWNECQIQYKHENKIIEIKIKNPNQKNKLKKPLVIDLKTIKNNENFTIILND
ncbi:MAG: hypothetical protein LBJ09_00330 [Clostridiales bacterium]|jgi:cellobiose phosphorylase|nr:hypothetical protein [Clostridiales bacterium]